MRSIVLIFFSLTLVSVNPQVSFFFRPVMETKADFASSSPFRFSDKIYQQSDYFYYDNVFIKNPISNFSLSLGGLIGLKSKNNKHLFELGYVGDQTQAGFKLGYYSLAFNIDPTSNYSPKYHVFSPVYISGHTFKRISFQHSFLLNKNPQKKQKLYFISGLSFGIRNPNVIQFTDYFKATLDTNVYLLATIYNQGGILRFVLGHVGLSGEIHTKKNYLFDFSIFVNKRFDTFSPVSYVTSNIDIYKNDAIIESYIFTSSSNGTGIYFQLSRKLQFYPWLKHKKDS